MSCRHAIWGLIACLAVVLAGCGGTPPSDGGNTDNNGGNGGGGDGGGLTPSGGFTISGVVRIAVSGSRLAGVALSTQTGDSATTDANGDYLIEGLSSGNYTITPMLSGYVFTPPTRMAGVGPNAEGVDFTALAVNPPPLSDASASITLVGGGYRINASATGTYSGPGELEVLFLIEAPDASVVSIVANVSGSVYSISYDLPVLQEGAYYVTVLGRDSLYPDNETRLELGEVLRVPPGPPAE